MNNLLFSMADFSANMVKSLESSLGIWYLIILNAFGVIAIICKILEYQAKSRVLSLTLCSIASVCWVAYFAFYGDFKELNEEEKETVRDMVRLMRERRAAKQRD